MPQRLPYVWTKALPTEDGFYWWRDDGIEPHVVEVDLGGVLSPGSVVRLRVTHRGGEWFGPLTTPVGDAIENCVEREDIG